MGFNHRSRRCIHLPTTPPPQLLSFFTRVSHAKAAPAPVCETERAAVVVLWCYCCSSTDWGWFVPGAARGDNNTPSEPQCGLVGGIWPPDSVHMCKLGLLWRNMWEQNASVVPLARLLVGTAALDCCLATAQIVRRSVSSPLTGGHWLLYWLYVLHIFHGRACISSHEIIAISELIIKLQARKSLHLPWNTKWTWKGGRGKISWLMS